MITIPLTVLGVVCLLLVLMTIRFRQDRKQTKVPEARNPLEKAVDEFYGRFEGMSRYFERLNEEAFRAFCHSQISGGIGMQIRNECEFWTIFHYLHEGKPVKAATKNVILYQYLKSLGCKDPDAMSDRVIAEIYRKYWAENPSAKYEYIRFQRHKNSGKYEPVYPFDLRYPDEKSHRN